ncbi:MAG TPA: hypothetical protein QF804_09995 [Rhodospirillales bacterium]|jgi:hypothetical protein|nr:hypothetical protein [Rhodospirillales bacterium]HJO69995.1 hypothetical protein [Rhodospirillales bacterium]
MAFEKSRTWKWRFEIPVETIWPVLADTARFNEAAQLPRQWIEEIPRTDGSVRWLEHRRDSLNGPLRSLTARLAFAADGAGDRSANTPRPRFLQTRSGA